MTALIAMGAFHGDAEHKMHNEKKVTSLKVVLCLLPLTGSLLYSAQRINFAEQYFLLNSFIELDPGGSLAWIWRQRAQQCGGTPLEEKKE